MYLHKVERLANCTRPITGNSGVVLKKMVLIFLVFSKKSVISFIYTKTIGQIL